jgi:hypothetical protein
MRRMLKFPRNKRALHDPFCSAPLEGTDHAVFDCGWSVTLELSKTEEGGKAVHECCCVRRTLSKFRKPIDELPSKLGDHAH